MPKTYNRENLLSGAADIFIGPASEPLPATIDDDLAGNWRHTGYTNAASVLTVEREYAESRPQQATMAVKRVITSVAASLQTMLGEATLENLLDALAGMGTITDTDAGTGTPGESQLDLDTDADAAQEFAIVVESDTGAPSGFRRRVYVPLVTVGGSTELSQDRDEFAGFDVTFDALDAGSGAVAVTIIDKTADAL